MATYSLTAEESKSLNLASWPSRCAAYVIDYLLHMVGVAVSAVGLFVLLIALFEEQGDNVVPDAGSLSEPSSS